MRFELDLKVESILGPFELDATIGNWDDMRLGEAAPKSLNREVVRGTSGAVVDWGGLVSVPSRL